MDGTNATGWWKLNDPIKDWGDALAGEDQEREAGDRASVGLRQFRQDVQRKWDLTNAVRRSR
jgi:hypothetical protein